MPDTIKVVAPDGTAYHIDNSPESVQAAVAKGYKTDTSTNVDITPLQEQAAHPGIAEQVQANAPAISQSVSDVDLYPGTSVARVVDPDGVVHHIDSSPDSIKAAQQKGYQLVSDVVNQAKAGKELETKSTAYQSQFKPDYDNGMQTFLQNASNPGGVIDNVYNHVFDALGVSDSNGPEFQTPQWQAVPRKFRGYLFDRKVPPADLPAAVDALEHLEDQHQTAATAGGIVGSGVEGLPLIPVAEFGAGAAIGAAGAAIGAAGVEGAGILPTLARFGIRTAVQTAVFNGPDALKTAIVDKDPALAVDNLTNGFLTNGALNFLGGVVGKGIDFYKGKPTGLYDVAAQTTNGLPGIGDIDRIQSDILRQNSYEPDKINDLTKAGKAGQEIQDTVERIPNLEKLNTVDAGRAFKDLGETSGKEIGAISDQLDQLSTPKSKVELPEAHDLTTPPEDKVQERFVNDTLWQAHGAAQEAGSDLSFNDWKTTPEAQQASTDALKQFNDIKEDKLTLPDLIQQRLQQNFNQQFSGQYTAQGNPDQFDIWKKSQLASITKTTALEDFRQVHAYSDEAKAANTPAGTDNYAARADGNKLLKVIDSHLPDATGAEQESFLKNTRKLLTKHMDENGKISPTKLKEIATEVYKKIPKGVFDELTALKKTIYGVIEEEKNLTNNAIANGAGRDDLTAKLDYANRSYQIAKNANFGLDLITNPPQTSMGGRGIILGAKSAAFFAARKVAAPFWSEFGPRRLSFARLRAVAKTGADPIAHGVIQGTIEHQQFIKRIPSILQEVAAHNVNVKEIRKEKEEFDGLKVLLGDEANGLSKAQQYQRVVEKLSDPQNQQRQLSIAAEAGSGLSQGLQQKIQIAHQILQQIINPLSSPQPFTKEQKPTPTEQKLRDINDAVRLINNPQELFKDFQDGTLTDAKRIIVKTVSPGAYANMMQQVDLENRNIHFSLQDRLLLTILKGQVSDPSLANVAALQSVSGQAPAAMAPAHHGRSTSGNGNRHGSREGAASYATPSQKTLLGYK